MKKLFFILLFYTSILNSRADLGFCYCYEVEVVTASSTFKGFIREWSYDYIDPDSLQFSDYFIKTFRNFRLGYKPYLEVHNYIIPINLAAGRTVSYLSRDLVDTIMFNEITRINYISNCDCYIGTIVENKLSKSDAVWASSEPKKRDKIEIENCSIAVLFYEQSQEINLIFTKLKEAAKNRGENWKLYADHLQALLAYKVIVIPACVC